MPEKPLTIATYAAGASLAAITLVYVFGPTFFIDDEVSSTKKKSVVGLSNAANDCFINSVLQALAGLPDLRIYLIRETHRRKLDGPAVYEVDPERVNTANASARPGKLEGEQQGLLTYGLKDILDALNERPLYKKTISPQPFIRSLERAFGTRISRQQQDAQEFLQIVTERLCDEYHAGTKARRQALKRGANITNGDTASERQEIVEQFGSAPPAKADTNTIDEENEDEDAEDDDDDENEPPLGEEGFPFEGKIESQIECETCHFKPKPSVSTFVTLTLNVPQVTSTTLNACFDGMLKVEYIDDFKCERCRLEHALRSKDHELSQATEEEVKERLQSDITKIRQAMEEDPESPPEGVELPDSKQAPKRRISRHMYISQFPKVLAIHLSRSVYAIGSVSTKNLAKVAFPESLPLGGLLHRKNYKLLGAVTHKGSHNSGHYEAFRRQVQPLPFSTPVSFGTEGAYSRQASPYPSARPSAVPSAVQSPRISSINLPGTNGRASPVPSTPTLDSPSMKSFSSQDSMTTTATSRGPAPTSAPREPDTNSLQLPQSSSDTERLSRTRSIRSLKDSAKEKAASIAESNPLKRKPKKASNRWWGISDDKVKESKTSDVLGRQKEVYLLFYELDRT
jgi:ubiquitin carboxyl-terminal hydrolase 16